MWIPDSEGIGWRVPMEGSLGELLGRHIEQIRRVQMGRGTERWVAPPAPPTVFPEVGYLRRSQGRRRPVHVDKS